MNAPPLRRSLAVSALIGLALLGFGCGSPSEPAGDAGRQDTGSDDASSGDDGAGDLSVDAGPFNALGPCDSDDDCDPSYTCSFAPNGVRICIAVGTQEDRESCGLPEEYQANRRCARGSHCDYIQRMSFETLFCRRACDTYEDCEATQSCIDDAFPGEGGLCMPSSCDFDALLSGQPPATDDYICSCVPWELVGEVGRARDSCASGNFEHIGEQCADTGSMVSWCNTWQEGADTTSVGAICVPGATSSQTCRQLCRNQSDCLEQGHTCTDITSQLTVNQRYDLMAATTVDHPIAQFRVCLPSP